MFKTFFLASLCLHCLSNLVAQVIHCAKVTGISGRLYILSTKAGFKPFSNFSTCAASLYFVLEMSALKLATYSSAEWLPCFSWSILNLAVDDGSGSPNATSRSFLKNSQVSYTRGLSWYCL